MVSIGVVAQRDWVMVPAADVKMIALAGSTVTTFVTTVPVQVPPALVNVGVMVNVTGTDRAVVLIGVPLILPLPVAAIPVTATVLSLDQP